MAQKRRLQVTQAAPVHALDLNLAMELADAADDLSLARFGATDLKTETKPDHTPVTEADQAIEEMMRDHLARHRPDDAVHGEEFGMAGASSRTWLLDPIDGTKGYMRGIPVFATLIALVEDGLPVVGVVSAPALHRRWIAVRGGGARLNGNAISVSAVADLDEAHLSVNDLRTFDELGHGVAARHLARSVWRVRGFGDFWSHMLVAEGAVDIAVEPVVHPWDLAALQVIVEEAGGTFTDLGGRRGFTGGSALSTNGRLHDAVLAMFGAAVPSDDTVPEDRG